MQRSLQLYLDEYGKFVHPCDRGSCGNGKGNGGGCLSDPEHDGSARLDPVDRLSKLPRVPEAERNMVTVLTRRFRKESRLRNKYNHCIYSFDPEGGTPLTIMMRIADRKDVIVMGKQEPAGQDELKHIDETIQRLTQLNLDIWAVIREQGYPL